MKKEMNFENNLEKILKYLKISKKSLAKRLGIEPKNIRRLCISNERGINLVTCYKILATLNLPLVYFFYIWPPKDIQLLDKEKEVLERISEKVEKKINSKEKRREIEKET